MRSLVLISSLLSASILFGLAQHVWAKEPITLHGSIKSFACGDNCYLTILTKDGAEVVGLCVAKECTPWNETTEISENLIGKKVVVTVGVGGVFDAEGNLRDEMTSFTSVRIDAVLTAEGNTEERVFSFDPVSGCQSLQGTNSSTRL